MKYFAKYLPVGGEINEEEYNKLKKDGIFQCYDSGVVKKMKLFLCSADIKKGDILRIRQYNGDNDWDATFKECDYKGHYICNYITIHDGSEFGVMAKDALKVIGEISSEAIWVKEGDEFEEEEWCYAYEDVCGLNLYDKEYFESVKDSEYDGGTDPWCIGIKCSQCNTFH